MTAVTGPSANGGSVRLFVVAAILLSIAVGATLAIPDYLPTNDGPEHVFSSHALRHLDDPAVGYGRYLRPGATFSQVGFDQLFSICDRLLGWRTGLRTSLVIMAVLWAWGVVAVVAAAGGRRRIWLGLFGFAAAVQWQLYMGLFAFYLASGFGLYVVALCLWRPSWTPAWRMLLSAGLACQALMHPVPAICTGLVFVIVRAWHSNRSTALREALLLVLMGIPTALVAYANSQDAGAQSGTVFLPLGQRIALAIAAFVPGPLWRSLPLPLCALAAAAVTIAKKSWRDNRTHAALWTAGLLFALVAMLAPHHLGGWQFFGMRFSPLAAVLLFPLLPIEHLAGIARVAGLSSLILFAVASNLWALGYNLRLREAVAESLSGLDAPIRRRGVRLPLILEPRAGEPQPKPERTIPYATANWNLGSLYAVEQGGVPAWTFAESETLHTVVWRWPVEHGLRPPRPQRGFEWSLSEPDMLAVPGARKAAVQELLAYAPYYEDVIFYGRPEEVAWLHERRFAVDYERGGLAIARFQPCPAVLEMAPGPDGHSKTTVYLGWSPATLPALSRTMPASPGSHEPRTLSLRECPCGPVWLRVLFDHDGDGRVSDQDSTCIEADARGTLVVDASPGENRLPCHPGRPLK